VRSAAAQALGSFSGSEKAPEIIDTLLAAIDDPSEKVCQAAIRSLGTLHAEAARPEIEEFLDDSNPFIAGAAVLALARLGAVDLAPRLAALLHQGNSYIKIQAVRAVGLLKYAPAGADIVRLLEETRQERQANGQVDLQTRLEWREDDLYSLQNQLIRAAGELQLNEAIPLLIETAQKDIGMRGLAIEALIAIGADIDPELVTNLLSDPSVYLRKRLMALITQHNYRQALPLIRPLLRSENASTRSAALQAVTQMNDAGSLGEVAWMCFHDSNPFVRVQAVQSLMQLAGKAAMPQLILLAGDANFQVRKAAAARLVEWEPAERPVLAALARFSAGSPEDELAPAIAAILQKNSFDPSGAAALTQPGLTPIPSELQVEVPGLLVILDRWRMALRQAEITAPDPETQKIEDALSCLISVLNEASQSA
jgi:HEAT repeat protein